MTVNPAANLTTKSGAKVATNQYGQVDVVGTLNNSAKQAQYQALSSYGASPTVRASTYLQTPNPAGKGKVTQAPVDQYGRQTTSKVGNQYMIGDVEYTPDNAFSGISGSGGSSGLFAPSVAPSGIAGGSSFTGLLGATGGASTAPVTGNLDDDEKKQSGGFLDILKGKTQAVGNALFPGLSSLLGTGGNLLSMLGDKTPQIPATPPQLTVAPVSGTQSADGLVTAKQNISKTVSNIPQATSNDDLGETNQRIATDYATNLTRQEQQNPIPANPVVDTEAQLAAIEASQDPQGLKSAMDQFRAEQTNLGQLTSDRLNIMKQVQALNQTYAPILEEIKNNPNLPKGLAMRRLEKINKSQKEVLSGFLSQLEILNQAIDDQNQVVNRAFQIVGQEEDKLERQKDNARQALQLMVSSGGIGGFTDQEIVQYSQATGIPTEAIAQMRTAANSPKTEVRGSVEEGFVQISIDKNGKATTKQLTNAQPKASGGGVLANLPVSIQGKLMTMAEGLNSNATVKKYLNTVDAINTVNGISAKSKNPADHQTIIYAFAKSLDPDSVVREGEYAVIAKYAQSLVKKFGKEVSQAIAGTGFLSEEAIKNIQTTMNNNYRSIKPNYDNIVSETGRKIDAVAGAPVSGSLLTDYSKGVGTQVNNGTAPALSSFNFKFQ
jgi:hypothetical protein